MKRKYYLLLILTLLAVLLSACRIAGSDRWTAIKKEKEIVVGLDDTFVPMGFRDKKDKIIGFDVDLAKAVFKEYGIKVKFQPIDWTLKETELKNESIDLIWNGYTVNKERAEKVAFSQPYMKNEQVLVTLKKNNIRSFAGMKGKLLGAQNGASALDDMAKQPEVLTNIIKNKQPELYDSFNDAFIDLNNNRIDGLIIDNVYARYIIAKQKNRADYRIITGGFKPADFAVGMRKTDKTLQKRVNQAFDKLYKEGKMQQISKKWFGKDEISKQPEN